MTQYVYFFSNDKTDNNKDMKDILGDKSSGLAEDVLHVLVAVGLAAAEEEDVLSHELPPSFDMSAMR